MRRSLVAIPMVLLAGAVLLAGQEEGGLSTLPNKRLAARSR